MRRPGMTNSFPNTSLNDQHNNKKLESHLAHSPPSIRAFVS
jgi:hypothetical protein